MLLSDYIAQVRGLIHDATGTDWSDSELTTHINNARTTIALDCKCVRTLFTSLDAISNQETYPISGGVGGIVVTAAGTGYTSTPTVTFTGGSPTTAATATVVLSGTTVASVYMTSWGVGYASAPVIGFTGGGGSGATATATVLLNVLDVFQVNQQWAQWGSTLRWRAWGPFQAYYRANRLLRTVPAAWTAYTAQNLLYLGPIPDSSNTYKMEWDAVTLPAALANSSDSDTQVTPPHSDAVQYWASFLALMKLQQFDQANVLRNLYKHRVNEIIRTRQTPRVPDPYSSYWASFSG